MAHSDNVSRHVFDIVAAFTSVRDVMRKLRARGRKNIKAGKTQQTLSGGELRLNESLRRGPVEIEELYAQGLRTFGNSYSQGDQHACMDMATILMRLNYGLVDIISNFIRSPDSAPVRLDYQALTALSDISSLQARNSLAALSQRLAIPDPRQIFPSPQAPNGDHTKETVKARRRHKSIPEGEEYFSISKQKNETRIALIRPAGKAKRTVSTNSAKASSVDSLKADKGSSSKKPSINSARKVAPIPKGRSRRTADSEKDISRNLREPDAAAMSPPPTRTDLVGTLTQPAPPYYISQPVQASTKSSQLNILLRSDHQPIDSAATPQPHPQPHPQSLDQSAISRRRPDINTETICTIASTNTKLGEIPMHRWARPFDYEAAARLNAEAETAGWVSSQVRPRPQKSPGLLKRLFGRRKTEGMAVM